MDSEEKTPVSSRRWRTPFYMRLKQLSSDIAVFRQESRGHMPPPAGYFSNSPSKDANMSPGLREKTAVVGSNDWRTPPRKRPPQVVVNAAASDGNSNASDQPLSTPANEVVTPTTKARLQEADDNKRKERQLVEVVSNLARNGRREELVKRLGEKDELIDSDELSLFLGNLKARATESNTMKSLESALKIPGPRAALLDVASALGAPPADRKRYVPGRKIDRREIVRKIF